MDTIAPGHAAWPAWAQEATAAVRIAPSGANRQPWRLHMDGDALVLTEAPKVYWTAPIDFGIAMLHAELGAAHAGVIGRWSVGRGGEVARFIPRTRIVTQRLHQPEASNPARDGAAHTIAP